MAKMNKTFSLSSWEYGRVDEIKRQFNLRNDSQVIAYLLKAKDGVSAELSLARYMARYHGSKAEYWRSILATIKEEVSPRTPLPEETELQRTTDRVIA